MKNLSHSDFGLQANNFQIENSSFKIDRLIADSRINSTVISHLINAISTSAK